MKNPRPTEAYLKLVGERVAEMVKAQRTRIASLENKLGDAERQSRDLAAENRRLRQEIARLRSLVKEVA